MTDRKGSAAQATCTPSHTGSCKRHGDQPVRFSGTGPTAMCTLRCNPSTVDAVRGAADALEACPWSDVRPSACCCVARVENMVVCSCQSRSAQTSRALTGATIEVKSNGGGERGPPARAAAIDRCFVFTWQRHRRWGHTDTASIGICGMRTAPLDSNLCAQATILTSVSSRACCYAVHWRSIPPPPPPPSASS